MLRSGDAVIARAPRARGPFPEPNMSFEIDEKSVAQADVWSEALAPDPQYEKDFRVVDNKFAFSPGQLNKLFNPKSLAAFYALGGLTGLEVGLQTDLQRGLSTSETLLRKTVSIDEARRAGLEVRANRPKHAAPSSQSQAPPQQFPGTGPHAQTFADRTRIFGTNALPPAPTKPFTRLLWDAYNDKIIILLTVAAVVSLALGIYEAASGQSQVDWIEGVAVCVAIVIVVSVTAGNDWQKQRAFGKLNKRKLDRSVRAVRDGQTSLVHIAQLTVGDVVHLEPGDSVPADGVLVTSHDIKCDESTATGESDQVEKVGGYEACDRLQRDGPAEVEVDPFVISGSKVLEGLGTYLVTSVGPHSTYGRIMVSLGTETDPTPLQVKLARLASWIGWFGLGSALLLFFVLFFRFIAQLSGIYENDTPAVKGQHFMDILIVAVTVIVVAIPVAESGVEGLPLAVTLALSFATARMLKENNLVRLLRACETMGNATVICSDKTGTLTQNKMSVVVGFFGASEGFGRLPSDERGPEESVPSTTISDTLEVFPRAFKEVLVHSLALNTTAFEEKDDGQGKGKVFVGNKTEIALLELLAGQRLLDMDLSRIQTSNPIEHVYPFDSSRKAMAVVYRVPGTTTYRLLVKGAPELLLGAATQIVQQGQGSNAAGVVTAPISDHDRERISRTIDSYARASLRTIGIAYRDFPAWPPGPNITSKTLPSFGEIITDITWLGAFGIHDPLRPEVAEAIRTCHGAGVQVKMVTGNTRFAGDNIHTALSIAESCGIKTADGLAMEGPELRKLSDEQLDSVIPRLQVLARSSPSDKEMLVRHLKRLGEIVAVTGDGTNDGPALKAADVGFSMGLSGTEVAREASSIILLDDNFRSIVTAMAWGRAVNDAVAKFLQFQITVNITAVVLTVVTAISNSHNESVFRAVQLLWLNLIMDTFAALALATDPPTPSILTRPPTPRHAPLFTPTMWKMILGQSIYKLALCFALYYAGHSMLGLSPSNPDETLQLHTIIFNTFVWMQIFNELNCRRLDNKFNIFAGLHRNPWFFVINVLMVGGQILIIFVGGAAFGVTRLSGKQWGVCLGFAVVCVPWAAVLKFVPDRYVGVLVDGVGRVFGVIWRPLGRGIGRMVRGMRACVHGRPSTSRLSTGNGKERVSDEEALSDRPMGEVGKASADVDSQRVL
ncbi:putative calcium transporting ATPase (Pmc1) [Aspergillus mulundensis]|uniref:Calcium-transporting ATPase n=1 Tax=Aspergillus mulundensis TaxID=1810919 RepID=A0A3D8RY31_9EURO|nr:Uncharacterized protein DSM5745_05770 [Aspergillus mulundensis]RDW78918.1 Uncharacterized protein DSM5745_05770 [Aspergillus mulundensis]